MRRKRDLIGVGREKLQPKLQMIANGSSEVNAVRAERSPALRITSQKLLKEVAQRRTELDVAVARRKVRRLPGRGKLQALAPNVEANVFIQLNAGIDSQDEIKHQVARQ